jgi:hypothetical protein
MNAARTMRYSLVVFLGISVASSLLAQSVPAPFGGRVFDADTKKGIPNLTVKLVPPKDSKTPELATATDANGNFVFQTSPTGRYFLEVDFGLTPVHREVVMIASGDRKEIPLRTGGGDNTTQVTVPARERWTKTYVEVQQGETIFFGATGQIHWGAAKSAVARPDGSTTKLRASVGSYPVRNMGVGGLIGKIGNGLPFAVGESAAITAGTSGTISLGINGNFFLENSGEFQVTITKAAR